MIKRSRTAPKAKKPQRISRGASLLLHQKGYGREPELPESPTDEERGAALSWYSSMCGPEHARGFLKDYLELQDRSDELRRLSSVPDNWLPRTAAWLARIATRGSMLPDSSLLLIERLLAAALARATVEPPAVVEQRVRNEAGELIGEIEGWVDSPDVALRDFLLRRGAKKSLMDDVIVYYGPWLIELMEARAGKDKQLNEAYRYMTKRQLGARIKFFEALVADADAYSKRAARTKKR